MRCHKIIEPLSQISKLHMIQYPIKPPIFLIISNSRFCIAFERFWHTLLNCHPCAYTFFQKMPPTDLCVHSGPLQEIHCPKANFKLTLSATRSTVLLKLQIRVVYSTLKWEKLLIQNFLICFIIQTFCYKGNWSRTIWK